MFRASSRFDFPSCPGLWNPVKTHMGMYRFGYNSTSQCLGSEGGIYEFGGHFV